ncbi:MAG: hypothetical protein M1834_001895 [Cirrosporium novae-zelandiae]|nr:MAG: hypothetical protein M1834_001895 [Cirrosporium novae-zelandiae]
MANSSSRRPHSPTKSSPNVDVVIVGAGLSGLTAASILDYAGLKVIVLEARNRVGGKTHTVPLTRGKGHVELGAAWINDTNQWRMAALAEKFGLDTIVQNTRGDVIAQDFDGRTNRFPYGGLPQFPEQDRKDIARIQDDFEALCHTIDIYSPKDATLDAHSMEQFLRSQDASPRALATAATWTRAMLGVEPSQISALFFLNYCKSGGGLMTMRSDREHGGQYLRIRQGTQAFSKNLARGLPLGCIHLNEPVISINQPINRRDDVIVKTASSKTYTCKRVIVSVPTPVYKDISFTPPLSLAKSALASETRCGTYIKAICAFRSPFWRSRHLCGLAQSFAGPASVVRDTSVDEEDNYTLTCFVVGDPGKAWSELPLESRQKRLLSQISTLFKDGDLKGTYNEFIEMVESEWGTDPWTGYGAPCPSTPPGVLDKYGDALRSVEGRIHFVGTETAGEWKGYMEGAVGSGERGGVEVLRELGRVASKL